AAFKPVQPKELSVFDDKHPRPKDEVDAKKHREQMTNARDAQIEKLTPTNAESLKEFNRVVGTALRVMIHSELPQGNESVGTSGYYKEFPAKWPGGFEGMKGIAYRASTI